MRLLRALIPALLVLAMLAPPTPSHAAVSIGISVGFAPPELPVYEQPAVPGPGYIWMPGYWAYGPGGYYWVPGTWVLPPSVGLYWTPPWWDWNGRVYLFHAGYWGPSVGYYGGINYGFGYFGSGYEGGRWDHGRFFYNRDVNNIHDDGRITRVYSAAPATRGADNHVAFHGGVGGIAGQPSTQERAAAGARHWQPTAPQTQHFDAARTNAALLHTNNHGQPPIPATNRAGRFNNAGEVTPHTQTQPRGAQPKGGKSG